MPRKAAATSGLGRAATALVQGAHDIWARDAPGRSEAKQETRRETYESREGEDAQIGRDLVGTRKILRKQCSQCFRSPNREQRPGRSADNGEKRAFREQLTENSRATRTEGGANAHFFFARSGAGQEAD